MVVYRRNSIMSECSMESTIDVNTANNKNSHKEDDGPQRTSVRKAVSFCKTVCVYVVPNISLSDERLSSDIWYNGNEFKEMKDDCRRTCQMVVEGTPLDPESQSFRGLEFMTPQGFKRKQWHKKLAYDQVLDVQDDVWEIEDPLVREAAMAAAYDDISKLCHIEAHTRGLQDELFIPKDLPQAQATLVDKMQSCKRKWDDKPSHVRLTMPRPLSSIGKAA
jgi:hypothetical protein